MAANWPKDNYTPDAFPDAGLDGQIIEDEWGEDVGATLNELTADLAAALTATDVSFDTIEEAVAVWAQRNAVVFTGLGSPVVEIDAVPTGTDTLAFVVWCENGHERRKIFVIENNITSPSSKLVDVNLQNCVVNVGDANASESFEGTKIRFLQPTGATGNLIEVLVAGSQTSKLFRVSNAGAVFVNSRGVGARAFAINTAAGDDAGHEPWFAINESGQIGWGPGGSGSALDATLGRASSGVLEVGGKIRQTGTPTAATDLTTKAYVDTQNMVASDWSQKVIGGGFQSSVAVSPVDSARIAVQTDVGGLRVTVNGADWYGLVPPATNLDDCQQGAAAIWSSYRRDWLFAVFGLWSGASGTGGLWLIRLPDDLSAEEPTWTRLDTAAVRVSSNSTVPALPSGHPRPSGNLLALDEDDAPTTTYCYVGTADSGVWRYTVNSAGTATAETRLASSTATGLSIMGITNRRQAQENSKANRDSVFAAVHDDRFDRPFTSDAATDRIYDQAHGLSNGARIMFVANPPGGCTTATSYFVVNRTTDYYQIAATAGGAAIDLTSTVDGHLTSNICSVSGSTITMTSHKLIAGTPIAFHFTSGNITAGTTYYVTAPATDTFQIATTEGGSALTFSGVGTHVAPYLDRLMWRYSTATGTATAAELAGSPRNCYDVAYVAGNGLGAQRCVVSVNKDGAYVADTDSAYSANFRFRNLVSGLTTNQEWGADGFLTTNSINEFVAVTNCAVSRQTTGTITPYYGIKHAVRLRSSAGGDMEAATTSGTNGAPVESGDVIVASIHTRANAAGGSGRTVKAGIIWYDSTGAQTGATTYGATETTSNTAWTRLHVVGTAPAAAKYYAVSLHVAATGGANEDHVLDHLRGWRVPATGETLAYKFEATAATNDTISTTGGHSFADGDRVVFTTVNGATGISPSTVYYVRDRASNSFKVSTTLHGAAVDITATGTLVGICLDKLNGWPAAIAGAHLPQADRYAYVVGINDPQLMSRIGDYSSYGCAYVGLAPPNDPARVTWYRLDHHDVDWRDVDGTVMELAETDSAFGRNAWLPSNIAASPLAPYRFLVAGRVATMELHVNGHDRPTMRPVMRPTGASMNFTLHRGASTGEVWASDSDWIIKRFFDYGTRTSISGYKTVNAVISANQTSRVNWFGPDGTLYIAGGNQDQAATDAGNSIWAFTRPGDDTSAINLGWRDGTTGTDATGLPMGGATFHAGTQRIVVGAARLVGGDTGGVFWTANLASAAPAAPAGGWTELTTTASGGVNAMKVAGDREDRAFFVWDARSPDSGDLGHLFLLDRRTGIWRFDLTSTSPVTWANGIRICGWSGTVGDSAARDECSAMLRLDPNVPNRIWWSLAGSADAGLRYLSSAHTAGAATGMVGTNVWPAAINTELPGPFDIRTDGGMVVATVGETHDAAARRNVRCYEVTDPASVASWAARTRLDDAAYRQVAWAPTDIRWDVDQQTVWVAPKGCGVLVLRRSAR